MKKILFALCLLLIPAVSFGANKTVYVDTDVVGGTGDGSSWANAYSTLAACEDAEDGVSYGAGETCTINCRGTTADTTAVTFAGWDADVSVIVNGDNTSGEYSTSNYRIELAGATCLSVAMTNNCTINQIQITAETSSTDSCDGISAQTDWKNTTIKNCIIRHYNTGEHSNGIRLTYRGTFTCYNNIVIGNGSGLAGINATDVSSGTILIANNTVYGHNNGIYIRATTIVVAKNNISVNNDDNDYYVYSGADWGTGTTHNLASDDTAPEVGTYYDNKSLTFVNPASYDLHLVSTDTDAIDKGADLSGTFTTDIDGQTRSGTWDIGADEYVAAATASVRRVHILRR